MAFGATRRVKIEIQASLISATLTDFPCLLTEDCLPSEMLDADGSYPAQDGGGDIRASSDAAGSTQLALEIVDFSTDNNPANGTAEIWVKIPSVSSTVDTAFYLWYNTASTDTQPAVTDTYGRNAVWSTCELAVHLRSTTPVDSTGSHTLTVEGTLTTTTGPWGQNAVSFDGNDRLTNSDAALTDIYESNDCMLYLISKRTGTLSSNKCAVAFEDTGSGDEITIYPHDSDGIRWNWFDAGGNIINETATNSANWIYTAYCSRGVSDHEGYRDGSSVGTSASSSSGSGPFNVFNIGGNDSGSQDYDGEFSDVLLFDGKTTDAWYFALEHNHSSPSTFAIEGTPSFGLPSYQTDIEDLGADHLWTFDGDSNDSIGSVNGTNSGVVFTGTAITKEGTNCMQTNTQGALSTRGDYVTLATTTEINNSAQARKCVAGWFQSNSFRPPPVHIYGEGNTTTKFQFAMAYGNQLMFECVEATNFPDGLQVYGPSLRPDRAYHLCGIFSGNAHDNEVKLFVDGIEQTAADPADRQPDTASLDARGVAVWGDAGTTAQGFGGDQVRLSCIVTGSYNWWATWGDEADALLTDNEIRETLFERGALAESTVSSDTEANMQTALDALTVSRTNVACDVEIEPVTGAGDFELESDLVFDDLTSLQFRFNSISGALTIVNVSGGNAVASKCAAPYGGTSSITIKNRQTLTITVVDAVTGSAVENARCYIEADTGGPETAGTVIMNTTTNVSGVATVSYDWSANQPIIGYVRQGTASTYYKQNSIGGPLTVNALDATIQLVPDE